MRTKAIKAVRTATHWIRRVLEVRLPMDVIGVLRTAERRFWRRSNLWMIQR